MPRRRASARTESHASAAFDLDRLATEGYFPDWIVGRSDASAGRSLRGRRARARVAGACAAAASPWLGCVLESSDLTSVQPLERSSTRRIADAAAVASGPPPSPESESSPGPLVPLAPTPPTEAPHVTPPTPDPPAASETHAPDAGVATESVPPDAAASLPSLAQSHPIVFRSFRDGFSDLFVMRADGSDPLPVTRGGPFYLPKWSPDGTAIAFRHTTESVATEVGLVAPDGSDRVLLTEGEHSNLWSYAAHWSPDGESLSFGSVRDGIGLWAWVMSRSGGRLRRLLPEIEHFQREAVWSPTDPSIIAYLEADASAAGRDVWVVDEGDASTARRLTNRVAYATADLRWSPDGTRLAFSGFPLRPDGSLEGLSSGHDDAGAAVVPDSEIFVVEVESGEVTRLTDNAGFDREPAWSPDGDALLVASDRDGDDDVWLLPLNDPGQVRNLTASDLPHADTSPDWYWGRR